MTVRGGFPATLRRLAPYVACHAAWAAVGVLGGGSLPPSLLQPTSNPSGVVAGGGGRRRQYGRWRLAQPQNSVATWCHYCRENTRNIDA